MSTDANESQTDTDDKQPQNDRVLITLTHHDMGCRAFSVWLDKDGNVVAAPEGDSDIEPKKPPNLMLTFKKNEAQGVSPKVAEYLLSLTHRRLDGPADIQLPLFVEGEPPAQQFAEMPIDEQVDSIHGQLGVLEQQMANSAEVVRQAARAIHKGPSDVSEVSERQDRLEANMARVLSAVESLAASLGPQKPAKKPKKKRGRPRKKVATARAKAEDRVVEESPVPTPEPELVATQETVPSAAANTP